MFLNHFFLGFYQQCNLKRHMASHNTPQDGAEGFKCSHCFASFTTKSGAKYLGFFLLSFPSKGEKKYTNWDNLVCLSLYIVWGKCVYFSIFEWFKCQIDFFWHNCDFYQSKIENKHTLLRAKLSSLVLREREETKTKYFPL